jgi:hypothetical protein
LVRSTSGDSGIILKVITTWAILVRALKTAAWALELLSDLSAVLASGQLCLAAAWAGEPDSASCVCDPFSASIANKLICHSLFRCLRLA